MSDKTKTQSAVVVVGATGYTGRFVIAELLRRGMTPIAIACDANALSATNFPENERPFYSRKCSSAAPFSESFPEGGRFIDGLSSGVNGPVSDLRVFCPIRN
jgi:hypothetical protein